MLVRIESIKMNHEILKVIKTTWNNRKSILKDDSPEAQDALFWFDILQEQGRLDEVHMIGEIIELGDFY